MAGAHKIVIPELQIIYRDVFVMVYFYKMLHFWLEEEGFLDPFKTHEYMESEYIQRQLTNKEYHIFWKTEKNPIDSSYYKYHLDIDMRVILMSDVEVIKNGRKVKAQKGEMQVKINPWIEVDMGKGWETHPILKYISSYFRRRLYKREMELHKKELYRDAYRLQAVIKKYLEMKSFLPEIEVYHEKGELIGPYG